MPKEINFYQEMASEHRLQEYCRGLVPLSLEKKITLFLKRIFFKKNIEKTLTMILNE